MGTTDSVGISEIKSSTRLKWVNAPERDVPKKDRIETFGEMNERLMNFSAPLQCEA